MNNDGWGQVGSGQDNRRLAGKDLQHNLQSRTADEVPSPYRIQTQVDGDGPMKDKPMQANTAIEKAIGAEKMRHDDSMKHHRHHQEKHNARKWDSQHGHDNYKYEG